MSQTLIGRVHAFLTAKNLVSGYQVKYFRWTDGDIDGTTPFILLRQSGNGPSSILMQQTDVSVILVNNAASVQAADTRMEGILTAFRGGDTVTGIIRFEPLTSVVGPRYFENGRPVFELTIRCYTADL